MVCRWLRPRWRSPGHQLPSSSCAGPGPRPWPILWLQYLYIKNICRYMYIYVDSLTENKLKTNSFQMIQQHDAEQGLGNKERASLSYEWKDLKLEYKAGIIPHLFFCQQGQNQLCICSSLSTFWLPFLSVTTETHWPLFSSQMYELTIFKLNIFLKQMDTNSL